MSHTDPTDPLAPETPPDDRIFSISSSESREKSVTPCRTQASRTAGAT